MLATLALLLGLTGLAGQRAIPVDAGGDVDVQLVLAVDMSGSMDIEEARVQRSGYVDALRHPDVINAVTGGLTGRVAISYFEWAGTVNEASRIDWHVIGSAADAEALAAKIAAAPVTTRRGTSISSAIAYGARLIGEAPFRALRRVIDVSGDGPNNAGPPVMPARERVVGSGIIINGLAIQIRPSASVGPLDRYYADCVIGGPGSFVLPVHKAEDFTIAIRQKLVLEISGLDPREVVIPAQAAPKTDCMIGEKLRPSWLDR
ncbi:DUF1194 domain-containing protein [Ensifer soli]|uniref:DUF1194 domain-containing protein n=1 Tax=Ciceribacter sp. sgz301302 TaxID=3342379 RepID=UPI0035BAE7F6